MRSKGNPIFGLTGFGVFFAGLLAISLHQLSNDEQFDRSTHRSQAIVEHVWDSMGSRGGTHYHVRFHFIDDQNRLWTSTADDISLGTYRSIRSGVIVPVKYLGEDPAQCRIDWQNENQYHWHQDKVLFYVALGIGLIWGLMLWSTIHRGYRS
jgi:hypothetical protein